MQKVIINKCFGGYGFVPFTKQKYADAKGVVLHWYKRDINCDIKPFTEQLIRIPYEKAEGLGCTMSGLYPFIEDKGYSFIFDWRKDSNLIFKMPEGDESRTDPLLIDIIEKYGNENRKGCYAPTVIEVPDGVEWIVDEYDGFESFHEKHRVFG